jgi:hypothetical protein
VITAAATILAAMIALPAQTPSANEGVLGLKLKRSNGKELTVTYHNIDENQKQNIAGLIESFMRGRS